MDRVVIQPPAHDDAPQANEDTSSAAELIRHKLDQLYSDEPDVKEEQQQAEQTHNRSKHQQFMHELTSSGKSLADIQTEWHNYYTSLPDKEKHEVWHEFYRTHGRTVAALTPKPAPAQQETATQPKPIAPASPKEHSDPRTAQDVKTQLLRNIQSNSQRRKKSSRWHSALFGLGAGAIVLLVFLFGFFNERFIAPFITPSKAVSSTPILIDPSSTAVGSDPKIIIPKINVEIPVVYDEPSIAEAKVQTALQRGVLHYATTPNPGELGNGVIFGHSANNILNKGDYKFAFVLLRKLEVGDLFYVEKDGKRYVYKVFEKKVVSPKEVSVLNTNAKPATFTLITCDPPGTNINRLVVLGEQISPDPAGNTASKVSADVAKQPQELPSNSPSLWSRIWD